MSKKDFFVTGLNRITASLACACAIPIKIASYERPENADIGYFLKVTSENVVTSCSYGTLYISCNHILHYDMIVF